MESTAYQVKRPEPLAVNDIEVTFSGNLPSDSTSDNDDQDDFDDEEHYVYGVSATIKGREIATGKQIVLGEMNADFLQVRKAMRSPYGLWDCCDAHSLGLAMLYKACFSQSAIGKGNMPDDYNWGDVSMVNTICLNSRFRGYGIGLLALDKLVKHVAQASPEWATEGLLVLYPSSMVGYTARTDNQMEVQKKLIQYYELFGLWPLAVETEKHCAFVGHEMINWRPEISTVVPHLCKSHVRPRYQHPYAHGFNSELHVYARCSD